MIACPICHKKVRLMKEAAPGETVPLKDDQTDDFECPTYVNVTSNRRWSHYTRQTLQGSLPHYNLLVPPFDVLWIPDGKLEVDRLVFGKTAYDTLYTRAEIVLQIPKGATFQDFLKQYERFKKLVVFS